jgi:hypothetical protein
MRLFTTLDGVCVYMSWDMLGFFTIWDSGWQNINICWSNFILSLIFQRPYIFWKIHDSSTFCQDIMGCLKSCQAMENTYSKNSRCILSYFIGVKPLIHQSELRTYTKVVPFKEKNALITFLSHNKVFNSEQNL